MEIFRSDGGGIYYDERLLNVVKSVEAEYPNLLHSISKIIDHKGTLYVHIDYELRQYTWEYYYSVFYLIWFNQCEHLVNICYDGLVVFGKNKGDIEL
jgi:hypothetical protein